MLAVLAGEREAEMEWIRTKARGRFVDPGSALCLCCGLVTMSNGELKDWFCGMECSVDVVISLNFDTIYYSAFRIFYVLCF